MIHHWTKYYLFIYIHCVQPFLCNYCKLNTVQLCMAFGYLTVYYNNKWLVRNVSSFYIYFFGLIFFAVMIMLKNDLRLTLS